MSLRSVKNPKPGVCPRMVNRGDSRWSVFGQCERRLAPRDTICRFHRSMDERTAKREAAWKERADRQAALDAEAKRLGKALGIEVAPEYRAMSSLLKSGYTGRFVVPGEWLRDLAARTAAMLKSAGLGEGKR